MNSGSVYDADDTRRPLRADARRNRERILCSARAVFGAQGPQAQMDEVASAAGVGVGTLYRHFPTKEALLAELVREQFVAFLANAHTALGREADPFEAFADLLRANGQIMACDAAVQHALVSAGTDVWERAQPLRDELLGVAAVLMERAKATGDMRPDLAPGDLPMLMCGLGASMTVAGPGFDWRRHLELLIDAMRSR